MAGYEFCKVVLLYNRKQEKIYGVIDVRFPKIGKPYTWGNKRTAEKAYAEQILFVPYSEYKRMKKNGYISAYKARKI